VGGVEGGCWWEMSKRVTWPSRLAVSLLMDVQARWRCLYVSDEAQLLSVDLYVCLYLYMFP